MRKKNRFSFSIKYPVRTADTFASRFLGLMGKSNVDYGLLLFPCKSIHTFFMKIPIDVVYLDRAMTIVKIEKNMMPWKTGKTCKNAYCILELPAGVADQLHLAVGNSV
ncbi:MAG: DUF192 domain-containing protein [Thermoclostridium sp.]|nr:DUF192 domain-containing protein [Thermoclostridium sp.]